jgi:hypothetical protein
MGVEFKLYLIPRDNTFRPDAATAERLSRALTEANFATGARFVRDGSGEREAATVNYDQPEMIVGWHIEDHLAQRLVHPLEPELIVSYEVKGEIKTHGGYYELELHFAEDFVTSPSEIIDQIDATCECGTGLEYDPPLERDVFYSSRIRRVCPECGEPFRPQDHAAFTRHPFTGEEGELAAGVTYRFAIVVDCGKGWVHDAPAPPSAQPAFRAACEGALGVPLYEVGYFS